MADVRVLKLLECCTSTTCNAECCAHSSLSGVGAVESGEHGMTGWR